MEPGIEARACACELLYVYILTLNIGTSNVTYLHTLLPIKGDWLNVAQALCCILSS